MRHSFFGILSVAFLIVICGTSGCSNGQSASSPGSTGTIVDFKSLKNPVAPTSKSIESGKRLYVRLCAECHGAAGDGVSEMASILEKSGKIPPGDLTDDTWRHGSTDGEIFAVIRDGSGSNLAMKGLNGRPGIVDEDIWNLVNYVHSLHK
jgi:cytochrome c